MGSTTLPRALGIAVAAVLGLLLSAGPRPAPAAVAPATPPDAHVPPGAIWFSTFEDSNPWSKWEGNSRPLQLITGGVEQGQIQVVDSASQGIPAPPGYASGTPVLLAQVTSAEFSRYANHYPRSYCCVQAKLLHGFGPAGSGPQLRPGGESGSYRVWYYLPADTPTFPRHARRVRWAQLMQWKIAPNSNLGDEVVAGEADLLPVDGKVWLCFGAGWPKCYPPDRRNAVRAPLGRWFELRADLYRGRRVDWFIDGVKVRTTKAVRRLKPHQTWIFGIGHYGGVGRAYAKNASFTPFG